MLIEVVRLIAIVALFAVFVTALRIGIGHYRGQTSWYNFSWERWIAGRIWGSSEC